MTWRRTALALGTSVGLAGALLCTAGCERAFFQAKGVVSSDGGRVGRWSSRPEGCSRDPIDGLPPGESPGLASFLWEDTVMNHDEPTGGPTREEQPDAPLRLDLWHEGGGTAGRLQTALVPGVRLDRTVCSTLDAQTSEQAPAYQDGRPTLRGRIRMDCRVGGSHIQADFTFSRCEY